MITTTDIDERVLEVATYFIENNSTVRETAKSCGVSKSTAHEYLRKRLKSISPLMYEEVSAILDRNASESAIRGGIATKEKYLLMKN